MLHNYGLISKEDLRPDFGGSEDMPEADSDLENEIFKALEERDERIEKIKNGIEHTEVYEDDVDENLQKKKKNCSRRRGIRGTLAKNYQTIAALRLQAHQR